MPRLGRLFVALATISVLLGLRELWLAFAMLIVQKEQLLEFVTEKGVAAANFEVIFVVAGGLFLTGWPIAYRKLQWTQWK